MPKIVSIIGWQNSGKTKLITKLVKEFKRRRLKVGTIKHAHADFEIDHKGKDSYRHFHAGSAMSCVVSDSKFALVSRKEENLKTLIRLFDDMDIVLLEGFKFGNFPKIEIVSNDQTPIHVKYKIKVKAVIGRSNDKSIQCFRTNEIKKIANYILRKC